MKRDEDKMKNDKSPNDEMRSEYDFSQGVRGKHFRKMRSGFRMTVHMDDGTKVIKEVRPSKGVIFLDPDIETWFPDSEAVNKALRCLIPLLNEHKQSKSA